MMEPIKVSVCVITYNQEAYIRQCLQSIVDQETPFAFEVIVGDDCSTDGTQAIVREFAAAYPQLVRPIFQPINTGGMGNYLAVHRAARGQYVSHVDGDDWLYPGKLSRQARFLDSNIECPMVAHQSEIWSRESRVGVSRKNRESIDLRSLLLTHPAFLHSSVMYRRAVLGRVFDKDSVFIDFHLYVHAAINGPIGFINEALGAYRRNIGISSSRRSMPYIQEAIDVAEPHANRDTIVIARSRQYLSYAVAALLAADATKFVEHIDHANKLNGRSPSIFLFFRLQKFQWLLRALVLFYKGTVQFRNRIRQAIASH